MLKRDREDFTILVVVFLFVGAVMYGSCRYDKGCEEWSVSRGGKRLYMGRSAIGCYALLPDGRVVER